MTVSRVGLQSKFVDGRSDVPLWNADNHHRVASFLHVHFATEGLNCSMYPPP